jgi:hypothetical protein
MQHLRYTLESFECTDDCNCDVTSTPLCAVQKHGGRPTLEIFCEKNYAEDTDLDVTGDDLNWHHAH